MVSELAVPGKPRCALRQGLRQEHSARGSLPGAFRQGRSVRGAAGIRPFRAPEPFGPRFRLRSGRLTEPSALSPAVARRRLRRTHTRVHLLDGDSARGYAAIKVRRGNRVTINLSARRSVGEISLSAGRPGGLFSPDDRLAHDTAKKRPVGRFGPCSPGAPPRSGRRGTSRLQGPGALCEHPSNPAAL